MMIQKMKKLTYLSTIFFTTTIAFAISHIDDIPQGTYVPISTDISHIDYNNGYDIVITDYCLKTQEKCESSYAEANIYDKTGGLIEYGIGNIVENGTTKKPKSIRYIGYEDISKDSFGSNKFMIFDISYDDEPYFYSNYHIYNFNIIGDGKYPFITLNKVLTAVTNPINKAKTIEYTKFYQDEKANYLIDKLITPYDEVDDESCFDYNCYETFLLYKGEFVSLGLKKK